MLVPVFVQAMSVNFGWRMAYAGFALLIFVLALPMAAFVLKETPEEMGLKPDGGPANDAGGGAAGQGPEGVGAGPATAANIGLSCRDAAKTLSFWLILTSFLLVGIGITGMLAHLVPMLIDRGVAPAVAALCMSLLALGLVAGRILAGVLMDRFFAPYVAAVFLLGLVAGIVLLATGASGWLIFVAALGVGLATGSEISEIAYISSRYFGPRAFGLIYGVMFSAFQLGSMAGAPLMGFYRDLTGNYLGALWATAGIVLVGTVLIALLGPYPELAHEQPGSDP